MPLNVNGNYVSPVWVDDTAPYIDADELNAMGGAVQGAVEYDRAMTLTAAQRRQARSNIQASRIFNVDTIIDSSAWTALGDTWIFDYPLSEAEPNAMYGFFAHRGNETAAAYDMLESAKIVIQVITGAIRYICLGSKPLDSAIVRAVMIAAE